MRKRFLTVHSSASNEDIQEEDNTASESNELDNEE
jgi:hypothetical protein